MTEKHTVVPNPPATLAELRLHIIEDVAAIGESQRQDALRAMDNVAAWLDRSLDQLPSNSAELRALLKSATHKIAATEQEREKEIKAIGYAYKRSAWSTTRQDPRLSPSWKILLLRTPGCIRHQLSLFARFCSARGIDPEKIADETLVEFLSVIRRNGRRKPTDVVVQAAKTWNAAAEIIADWPAARLQVPDFRRHVSLPLDAFPREFQDDLELCGRRLRSTSRVEGKTVPNRNAGYVSPFRSKSDDESIPPTPPSKALPEDVARNSTYLVRYAASELVATGVAIESLSSVAAVVSPAAARKVLLRGYRKKGDRRTQFLFSLAHTLFRVARIHVGMTRAERKEHERNVERMNPKNRDLPERVKKRLRQFDDERAIRMLREFPSKLVERALPNPRPSRVHRSAAIDLKVAAGTAILQVAPVTLKELNGISMGKAKNLRFFTTESGEKVAQLRFKKKMRNGKPLEFLLPPDVTRIVRLYMQYGRPRLMDPKDEHLFPQKGHPGYFSHQISGRLRAMTGLSITVSLRRHLAAKLHLDQNPGDWETVRVLLGHARVAATKSLYALFEKEAGHAAYRDEVLHFPQRLAATERKNPNGLCWKPGRSDKHPPKSHAGVIREKENEPDLPH